MKGPQTINTVIKSTIPRLIIYNDNDKDFKKIISYH